MSILADGMTIVTTLRLCAIYIQVMANHPFAMSRT